MKRLIYYYPGTYGTFVNWLCNARSPITEDSLPFGDYGNSHGYYEQNKYASISTIAERKLMLKTKRNFGVQRMCWPFNLGIKLLNVEHTDWFYFDVCQKDLQLIQVDCNKILFLCHSSQSQVWWYQNFCEKTIIPPGMSIGHMDNKWINSVPWIQNKDPIVRARHHLDLQKNQPGIEHYFAAFNKSTAVDFSLGELRTVLAYDLGTATHNLLKDLNEIENQFPALKMLRIEQLRDNFQSAVQDIFEYFELDTDITDSLPLVESEWLHRQTHKFKDKTVNDIVSAVINQQPCDWAGSINFFDEVCVEKQLTDHGISLYTQDQWPTNTQEFQKLIK